MDPDANRLRRVFLNVPYDGIFQPLYLAYIVGLAAFRLTPVLAISATDGTTRVDKIFNLLSGCASSIHDLSRIEPSGEERLPRFNMPFELGMAVALAKHTPERFTWVGFDSRRHQASRTLSDLAGSDFVVHGNTPAGVLAGLCDVFVARGKPSVPELLERHGALTLAMPELLARSGAASVYSTRMLAELVVAARNAAE